MRTVFKYLKEYKWLLIIGPFFKLVEAVLELFLPYFMSLAVDNGVLMRDKSYVIKMGGVMFCTATVGIVSALICQYTASIVSQGFGTKLRNAMFDKIMSFSNAEIDDFGTTSLINRLTADVNQLQTAVAMLIRLVIRAPFLCVGGVVMAVNLDVKLSVVLMVVLPMFIIVLAVTMIKTVPLYKKVQQKLDQIALVVRENLAGVRVIRAFSKVSYEEEKFENSNEEYAKTAIRVGKISSILNPLTSLIMNFAICAILWIGGIRVNSGSMSVGSVIAFINYVTQILAALIIVSNLVVLYTKAFASLGRVTKVLNMEVSIKEGEGIKEIDSNYAVEFEDVTFYYEGTKEPALTNINLKVKKGETIVSPKYDFVTCVSNPQGDIKKPAKVILTEGLYVLNEEVRDIMDVKVYVFTPLAVIKERWYKRAVSRGKTGEAADLQFKNVNETAQQYIRPTYQIADCIINGMVDKDYIKVITDKIMCRLAEVCC